MMENLAKIIEILAWPLTSIFIVMLLRAPLSELVPTLKKLKYKDLELEFEKEANKILAEAERDLPDIPEKPKEEAKEEAKEHPGVLFCKESPEPAIAILESWRNLELHMKEIAHQNELKTAKSIRSLISELESNGLINNEVAKIVLDLAALRNKVAHTNEEIITYEVSSSFESSVNRVMSAIEEECA